MPALTYKINRADFNLSPAFYEKRDDKHYIYFEATSWKDANKKADVIAIEIQKKEHNILTNN